MKKLVTAFTACMIAGLVSAAVESQNIVGYNTVTVQPGWNTLAINWKTVSGADSVTLQDFFAQPTNNAYNTNPGNNDDTVGDWLFVWNGAGQSYTKQYYFGNFSGAYGAQYDNKWYEKGNDAEPTTDIIPTGAFVWFIRNGGGAQNLSLAGEVKVNASTSATFVNGWTAFSNPYATELPINTKDGKGFQWLTASPALNTNPGNNDDTIGDWMFVWNSSGQSYAKQYYFGNFSGAYGAQYDNVWYEKGNDAEPTLDVIPTGLGAWFIRNGNGSTTVSLVRTF
jgi:hypothetical protein